MTRIPTTRELVAYARAEHATAPAAWPPGFLLAENARTARVRGTCALCRRAVMPGDRVADLTGLGWAHLPCVAGLRPGDPGAPAT